MGSRVGDFASPDDAVLAIDRNVRFVVEPAEPHRDQPAALRRIAQSERHRQTGAEHLELFSRRKLLQRVSVLGQLSQTMLHILKQDRCRHSPVLDPC